MSTSTSDLNQLPLFSSIQTETIEADIDQILRQNCIKLDQLLSTAPAYNWENLIQPLDDMEDRLHKSWSPVSHMNSVVNSDALRNAYNACLPKLSAYSTEMGQNQKLQQAVQSIANHSDFASLSNTQQKIINDALRDFKLSGIALADSEKVRYKEIAEALSKLSSKFEENVLDATQAWSKHLEHESDLSGLPDTARALARQAAEAKGLTGWHLTLDFPCYIAVMTYADNRTLRREMYEAFVTRASDQGTFADHFDNSAIMAEILQLRHEKARLLGFQNYAQLSLATKMADSTDAVMQFLQDLARRAQSVAQQDLDDLREYTDAQANISSLEAWDIAYFSEKLQQHQFSFSQQEVKQYFPVTRVVPGLFSIVNRLYGLTITELNGIDSWHSDVRFFEIRDQDDQLRGQFYLDLYARAKKRGGAWMDECLSRRVINGKTQTPVAYLTCNFTPPVGDDPALLTHDEVLTLFHEFGHGLQHMLTRIDYLGASGIRGVEWDAVELPSQFMENWCWQYEALSLISGHYQSNQPLPTELFEKMLAAKNFQAGLLMVRQLEFSLFDFRIHMEYDPNQEDSIARTLEQVRQQVAVLIPPAFNRFAHSFSHIFAGGYGAGYYSYKWAEVLSSDAFSVFEEKGIFNQEAGKAFLSHILEKGGSEEAMSLFTAFRGRKPTIDALLRHSGIT